MEEQLTTLCIATFNKKPDTIVLLTAHGSQRSYFRIKIGADSIIGTYSSNTKENKAFIELSTHLTKNNIAVPKLYGYSKDHTCYLQEDCGTEDLFSLLKNTDNQLLLLTKALDLLIQYQTNSATGWDYEKCYPFPSFDINEITRDFNRFQAKFLEQKKIDYIPKKLTSEKEKLSELIMNIKKDDYVMMHRDFQARNILVKNREYILIDYQNCRKGPLYYDLASLLFQSQLEYPFELREKLINHYFLQISSTLSQVEFRKNFYLMAFLRLIQSIGSYGIAGLIENKEYFRTSIPLALKNLRDILVILDKEFNIQFPYTREVINKVV